MLLHIAGAQPAQQDTSPQKPSSQDRRYYYPTVKSASFATPFTHDFHYNSEAVSHTRNLTFLKPKVNGPYFDLETIWDEHTYYEFADRSVQHTMSTMVQEPYVNHVPTVSHEHSIPSPCDESGGTPEMKTTLWGVLRADSGIQ